MVELKVDVTLEGITSAYVEASLNEGLKTLEQEGFKIIELWLNALLREQKGYNSSITNKGNYVREGTLCQKGENIRLLKKSLCLNHPEETTQDHSQKKEYTLENHLSEIEQVRWLGLEIDKGDLSGGDLVIPTKRFGSDKYAVFLFGGEGTDKEKSKRAQAHGGWLLNSPKRLKCIRFYLDGRGYIDRQTYPYAKQLWFSDFSNDCGASNRYCGVRGIKDPKDVTKLKPKYINPFEVEYKD